MEQIGVTISNLIESQFPAIYRENGPLFVAFVEKYFQWIEEKSFTRDEWLPFTVTVKNGSANVVGFQTYFTHNFGVGDPIAICKSPETEDYDIFTVKSIANNVFLTVTKDRYPNFTTANAQFSTVSLKPNAFCFTRNFSDIQDIDETWDEYVVYFKEKYLKKLQFATITDTKTLVKHSLDLYRSKGTERSIDLLYKIVFGKPAGIYYPKRDLFKLSSGIWYIPRYLELTLASGNRHLINQEIVGTLSGATAFVEEIIRRYSNKKIIEVAYISALNGDFITGEKVTRADHSIDIETAPVISGSLNQVQVSVAGTGEDFEENEYVTITSENGRGATGKVLTTTNTAGQIFFRLTEGGYGFSNTIQVANTIGTVVVNSACSAIVGTGTLFTRDYQPGDYISFWPSQDQYETHQVVSVTSNTLLSIGDTPHFNNAVAVAAYTRTFAQTYISDKILHLSNVTITGTYNNFEYVTFLDTLKQPLAQLHYLNSNGLFKVGDNLTTYNPGGSVKGTGKVLDVLLQTTTSGTMVAVPISGSLNDNAIYTTANAIGANLSIIDGYTDISATGKVIGNYSNVTVTCNNINGVFHVGEQLVQPGSGASGTIIASVVAGTNVIIGLTNSTGIFKSGFEADDVNHPITGNTSLATANVVCVDIDVGVIITNNAFLTFPGNIANTAYLTGRVDTVSSGIGANVIFSESLDYPETISVPTDYIRNFLQYNLAVPVAATVNVSQPNVVVLSVGNTSGLKLNYRIANSSNLACVNTQVNSRITSIINSTAFGTNSAIVKATGTANLIARVIWPFYANNVVDLEFVVNSAFTHVDLTLGKIDAILSSSPGTGYNQLPIIRLHDPTIFSYNYPDTITLSITSSAGFANGEIVTQISSNARGMVKDTSDATKLVVQNMRFSPNNMFVVTANLASRVVGANTGTSSNVTQVSVNQQSARMGSDVTVNADLVVGSGAITSMEVIDSGFGFLDGEFVWIASGEKLANGYAVDFTNGVGQGYYKSKDGFLSDDKKLSDGYYWQEYSYEVRSGVTSDFKNILKDIVHVAGTKYFDALLLPSLNPSPLAVTSIITQGYTFQSTMIWNKNALVWGLNDLDWTKP